MEVDQKPNLRTEGRFSSIGFAAAGNRSVSESASFRIASPSSAAKENLDSELRSSYERCAEVVLAGVASGRPFVEPIPRRENFLHAPDLLLIKSANALWKRAALELAGAALDLAVRHKHSVHYVVCCALAQDLGCDLITADATLVVKLHQQLPYVRHLSAIKT